MSKRFRPSILARAVSVGIFSLVACTPAFATLSQLKGPGQDPQALEGGVWNTESYPFLQVQGGGNTYENPIFENQGNDLSIQFLGNDASLQVIVGEDAVSGPDLKGPLANGIGIQAAGKGGSFQISGTGNLSVQGLVPANAETIEIPLDQYSALYVGTTNAAPTTSMTIEGNINLNLNSYRGIAVQGGNFTYNCPDGTITIGSVGNGDAPLFNGIAADSENDTTVPSLVDITAKSLTINLSGTSNYKEKNRMIKASIGTQNPPSDEQTTANVNININASQVNLLIQSDFQSKKEAIGIYGESGKYYSSTINLQGDNFLFLSKTSDNNKVYGIYSLSHGKDSTITLKFNNSINFKLSSSTAGINPHVYHAVSTNDVQVNLEVTDPTGSIVLQNASGDMIDNNGATVYIKAPSVEISSGSGNAIWTLNESVSTSTGSKQGGITTIEGNSILIYSNGTEDSFDYGIFTYQRGSKTLVKGASQVEIYAINGAAVVSMMAGVTQINSNGTIALHSEGGSAIDTEYNGANTVVNGNIVTLTSESNATILTSFQGNTTVSGTVVTVSSGSPAYTTWTDGAGSTTSINYNADSQQSFTGTTIINGRVLAYDSGQTDIGMGSSNSIFTGSTDDGSYWQKVNSDLKAFGNGKDITPGEDNYPAGQISIYANNGSRWIVKPNPVEIQEALDGIINQWSNLYKYHSYGFSVVDLTTADTGQNLDILTLSGNSAAFKLRTYVDDQRVEGESGAPSLIRDHVDIYQGTGQHFIVLPSSGRGAAKPEPLAQTDYLVWVRDNSNTVYITDPFTGATEVQPSDSNLSFRLGVIQGNNVTPTLKVDIGIYNYYLATRDKEHDKYTDDVPYNQEGTEFYLVRGEKYEPPTDPDPTPDPDPGPDPTPTPDPEPEYSPSTDVLRELAGFGAQYAIWWADLSDLRKRLGEVRYGAQDGAWARGITQKDSVSGVGYGGFTQKLYAVNIGIDHFAVQDEDRWWLLGGNFKYANANQRVKRSEYGKGDVHSWGANLYATYANQYGCYSDFVLTYDHYESKLRTRMLDNTPVGAKWNNYGYGVSLEVGKMFSSMQDDEGWGPWYNHWWIEPQAQLAYYRVHGKSFTLSNGMKADPHNIDFLTGRLGVVIGKKFNYGKEKAVVDKRYSQFYIKGGIKHEFLGKQRLTVSDTVNEVTFKGDFRGTRVYYGGGFDWNFTDQLRLYAQVEREHGHKYRKDYEISVGLKWQF